MKAILNGELEIVMHNPDSRHSYFAWPTVTRLQNGKIAVVASGYRAFHLCPFGKTVISYSEDEGKTYTAPAPVFDTPLDDRDGGILAFGKSGVIVTSFNNTVKEQRAWAEGWAKNAGLKDYFCSYLDTVKPEDEEKYLGSLFRISNDCGVTFGPIYKAPVSSPHGPCELPDGSLLYVGWEFGKANQNKGEHEFIQAYKINPDGTSEYVGDIPAIELDGEILNSEEPYAVALDDGTVICHIRVENGSFDHTVFTTYQTVSKDGGRTWSKPERIIAMTGGAPAHILKHSSGALVATFGYREKPYGIKAAVSLDNGKTWNTDLDIFTDGINGDLGYPSTVELNDGSLLTVFYTAVRGKNGGKPAIVQQRWHFEA